MDSKERMSSLLGYSLTWGCVHGRYNQLVSSPGRLSSVLISVSLDVLLGLLLLPPPTLQPLPGLISQCMEHMVSSLQSLLHWLMENPAGLKLNPVLAGALAKFFLYHVHLWATYVMLVLPLTVYLLPSACLSLQVAMLGDLFSLLTIHIHCFYAYARRLALCQKRGLVSLWRLFLGKKYNPLRDRVDSADCSVEQLFLGTIVFTILLFLLPTTLTFFVVFSTLKLAAVAVNYVFKGSIKVLHYLP